MPRIYVCFVWHMHQPCYKDLVTGEYRLPWTRLHGLKDYYGMVKILDGYPRVHQTLNLVPSLLLQIEEYATGHAVDPFLRCALKPAEDLTEQEVRFILQYFFQANPTHLIARYPRYSELYEAWRAADRNLKRAMHVFNPQALRDLQVLSQVAWFEEEFLEQDEEVIHLVSKGRDYNLEDQALMGRKQLEILNRILPTYRDFAQSGQIEISATPFYHPILPLICDSNIAHEANPHVPLPSRFRYPQDAEMHLRRSVSYVEEKMGKRPLGLWPSEGSVSDEALGIAAETGYRWAATDNGVLAKTLGRPADPFTTYRPYLWKRDGRQMNMIFRDHELSDLVGFVYSRMHATDAAADFIARIKANCQPLLSSGRDALVPVILDGENAWEHYYRNGRPFLKELYEKIANEPGMSAVTVSEALEHVPADDLTHISPGSWIGANFDVWIGFEEDNKAWEQLLKAREAFGRVDPRDVPADDYALAKEELMIAEGSDWCWWYGPHHDCDNRTEFDQLFRDHLANMYRVLRLTPPADLSKAILKTRAKAVHHPPVSTIRPTIDGEVTSYFEWMGAGLYRADAKGGSMHGHRFLVKEMQYGSDEQSFYLRLDFLDAELPSIIGTEVHVSLNGTSVRVRLDEPAEILQGEDIGVRASFRRVLELSMPIVTTDSTIEISVWQNGLPMDSIPQEGRLLISPQAADEWGA